MATSFENRDYKMDILKTAFTEDELRLIVEKNSEYANIKSELDRVVEPSKRIPYTDEIKSVEDYDADDVNAKRQKMAEIYDRRMKEAVDIALLISTEDGLAQMKKKERSELESQVLEAFELKKTKE